MPIEYQIQPEAQLIIFKHVGVIPDDEFLAFYTSIFESGQIEPSMNLLVDLRETQSENRSGKALRTFSEFMIQMVKDRAANLKIAVVAPRDISFGLARMYEAFSSSLPLEFIVFRTLDEALAYLELPASTVSDLDAPS